MRERRVLRRPRRATRRVRGRDRHGVLDGRPVHRPARERRAEHPHGDAARERHGVELGSGRRERRPVRRAASAASRSGSSRASSASARARRRRCVSPFANRDTDARSQAIPARPAGGSGTGSVVSASATSTTPP